MSREVKEKTCLYCGNTFKDTSPNRSRSFCDSMCYAMYHIKKSNGGCMAEVSTSYCWQISKICTTCSYRKPLHSGGIYNWDETYCSYLDTTGEVRGCTPTDDHCDRYSPRFYKENLYEEAV